MDSGRGRRYLIYRVGQFEGGGVGAEESGLFKRFGKSLLQDLTIVDRFAVFLGRVDGADWRISVFAVNTVPV